MVVYKKIEEKNNKLHKSYSCMMKQNKKKKLEIDYKNSKGCI